jgi:hypothetical protein
LQSSNHNLCKASHRLALQAASAAVCALFLLSPVAGARGAKKAAADPIPSQPSPAARVTLDNGFRDLYKMDFEGARLNFHDYQQAEPASPLGKVAEAASYLYEQFNDKGVLTSEFFLDDARFLGGVEGSPALNRNEAFLAANSAAREAAKQRLKENPRDPEALLAITMADGMESNYDQIIERKPLAGLSYMRQAEDEAKTLLAVDPSAQDAYVALGTSNYVIGSLNGFKRAFLWFGGIHGDKDRGMDQLQSAVDHGHYLQPFAKILLALVSERERQDGRARTLLTQLNQEFPENPLFARELKIADQRAAHSADNR